MSNPNAWMDHEPTFPEPGDTKHNARIDTGRMKPVICPECHEKHDGWTGAHDNPQEVIMPHPGSIIICSSCGAINQLTESHTLEPADLEELARSLAQDVGHAKDFFEAMLSLVHLRKAKKNLEALRAQYAKWCNDPDVAMAKDRFGIDLPPGSKVAVLTETELYEIYNCMIETGVDHIGKLKKLDIEKMFADAGKPLKSSALQ